MESVDIEIEESTTAECTCDQPFTLVRYRDQMQEPSFINGVCEGSSEAGVFVLTGEDGLFLFAAPLEAILSVERID